MIYDPQDEIDHPECPHCGAQLEIEADISIDPETGKPEISGSVSHCPECAGADQCIQCDTVLPELEASHERLRRKNNELRLRLSQIWILYVELARVAGEGVENLESQINEALKP